MAKFIEYLPEVKLTIDVADTSAFGVDWETDGSIVVDNVKFNFADISASGVKRDDGKRNRPIIVDRAKCAITLNANMPVTFASLSEDQKQRVAAKQKQHMLLKGDWIVDVKKRSLTVLRRNCLRVYVPRKKAEASLPPYAFWDDCGAVVVPLETVDSTNINKRLWTNLLGVGGPDARKVILSPENMDLAYTEEVWRVEGDPIPDLELVQHPNITHNNTVTDFIRVRHASGPFMAGDLVNTNAFGVVETWAKLTDRLSTNAFIVQRSWAEEFFAVQVRNAMAKLPPTCERMEPLEYVFANPPGSNDGYFKQFTMTDCEGLEELAEQRMAARQMAGLQPFSHLINPCAGKRM